MLSRTADHLFWMARYVERAENTARMLDVNLPTSLLPQSAEAAERGWRAMLGISELQEAFDAKYAAARRRATCSTSWCATRTTRRRSPSCLQRGARERARGARHAHHRGVGDA